MENIKTSVKITILVLTVVVCFFVLSAFFLYVPTLVDVRYHYFYMNEMIIISANIEAYKSHNGYPPNNLEEVKKITLEFLEKYPSVKEKYLVTTWTSRKIDLFKEARHGYEIGYFANQDNYYLYLPTHKVKMPPLNIDNIEGIISSSSSKYNDVIVIKNGMVINGPMPLNSKPFTLNDLPKTLKDCSRFKSPGLCNRILIETYEKLTDCLWK